MYMWRFAQVVLIKANRLRPIRTLGIVLLFLEYCSTKNSEVHPARFGYRVCGASRMRQVFQEDLHYDQPTDAPTHTRYAL